MPERIVVEGADELRAALKAAGDLEGTKEFKAAGKEIATGIASKAKGRADSLGRMQAKAGATIKPSLISGGAAVRFGGGVIWAMGSEFGAGRNVERSTRRGPVKGWNQFDAWRGSGSSAGYFLWPTIRDEAKTIVDDWDRLTAPVWQRLFPE